MRMVFLISVIISQRILDEALVLLFAIAYGEICQLFNRLVLYYCHGGIVITCLSLSIQTQLPWKSKIISTRTIGCMSVYLLLNLGSDHFFRDSSS